MGALSLGSLAAARALASSGMSPNRFAAISVVEIDGEFGTIRQATGHGDRFAGQVGPDHDWQRTSGVGSDHVTVWVLVVPAKVVLRVGEVIHDYERSIDYKVTEARSVDAAASIANTYLVAEVPA